MAYQTMHDETSDIVSSLGLSWRLGMSMVGLKLRTDIEARG
jgi:hypothetical protein